MHRELTGVIDLEVPIPPRWCRADNPPTFAVAEDHADLVGLAELRVGMAAQVVAASGRQCFKAMLGLRVLEVERQSVSQDPA
jgi:hypothetical protein